MIVSKNLAYNYILFLTITNEEGDDSLSHIVTADETWLSHMTLESTTINEVATHSIASQNESKRDIFKTQDHGNCILEQLQCITVNGFYAASNSNLFSFMLWDPKKTTSSRQEYTVWNAVNRYCTTLWQYKIRYCGQNWTSEHLFCRRRLRSFAIQSRLLTFENLSG
ncbi:hypothetical protein Trydic_g13570 [Trypoxylus dichotomus]